MQIQTLSVKNKSNWLPLLLALACWSCGQNKTTSESVVDSLMIQKDAAIIKATGYPNVYEIPSDYPWLVRLIGQRFPWDSAGTCSRVTAFNSIFPEASTTSDQIEDDLVTEYSYKDSFIKVSQLSFKEMQDCMDNICEVVLTSDWVPIGLGLNVGMTKSRFLEALSLNKSLTQNIYNYVYKVDDRNSIQAVFEFQDELPIVIVLTIILYV